MAAPPSTSSDPNNIASVPEVLKDASATAIYGARGANGVILVTTKRGSTDGGRVTYDTKFSVGVLPRKLPLLNSAQFPESEETAYQNAKKYDPVGWAGGEYRDPLTKRPRSVVARRQREAALRHRLAGWC